MIKNILIVILVGWIDQHLFDSHALQTIVTCWVLFGALIYIDFKRHTKMKVSLFTDVVVGAFTCLLGPLNLFI